MSPKYLTKKAVQLGAALQVAAGRHGPDDNHRFCSSDTDELVDRTDTTSGQFGEKDHALNVVVFQQMDVGAHVGDRPHVDHDHVLHFRELLLVEPTRESHLGESRKTIKKSKTGKSKNAGHKIFQFSSASFLLQRGSRYQPPVSLVLLVFKTFNINLEMGRS